MRFCNLASRDQSKIALHASRRRDARLHDDLGLMPNAGAQKSVRLLQLQRRRELRRKQLRQPKSRTHKLKSHVCGTPRPGKRLQKRRLYVLLLLVAGAHASRNLLRFGTLVLLAKKRKHDKRRLRMS